MFDSESVNGYFYAEELDLGDEYAFVSENRSSNAYNHIYDYNPLYYHKRLFELNENYNIVHQTEKAILFEVNKGKFWVPKTLIRGLKVHRDFKRRYI